MRIDLFAISNLFSVFVYPYFPFNIFYFKYIYLLRIKSNIIYIDSW